MDISRVRKNVQIDSNGCWVWQKSCNSSGYGQLTENGKYWTTHKYVYTCIHGEIPKGLVVRHKCHNTKCCNPDHLIIGTNKDNWHDSKEVHLAAARKTAKSWSIAGVTYPSIRAAVKATGISLNSISKYTSNGVFDIQAYQEGCRIANVIPKI